MSRESYTKKRLAEDLGLSGKQLTRYLLTLEPELLVRFPHYRRNCQILTLSMYRFILDQYGYEKDEIMEKTQRFRKNFGC